MKFRNSKAFTGIEIIIFVVAVGIVTYFAAPSAGKAINNIFSGARNQQKQIHKVTEQYSMFYRDDKGNFRPAPIPYKRTEDSLNFVNAEPPETLWQKFWHLGFIAVAIIVLLSYLGLWPIIVLWWNKKIKPKITQAQSDLEALQASKKELSDEARRIVLSVDEGLAQFDLAIESAGAQVISAQNIINSSSNLSDVNIRAATISTAQLARDRAQEIKDILIRLKKDFLSGMSRKQDASTKLLVSNLLQKDTTNVGQS